MATLLLAKRLTNAVSAAATQAGISLEYHLQNYRNDGERRAAGCKGVIMHPTTKARVVLLTTELCPDEVRIEFTQNHYDEHPDEVHCTPTRAAVRKIIELLTPPTISHENLSASGITNLPNLADNPLLALYLCDGATCTQTWSCGRTKLKLAIASRGFSPDDFTDYPPSYGDKAYEVANVLWRHLAQSCTEPHMVAHHLLTYHDVGPSEPVKGCLAYYQDDAKRRAGIRTPIKVRKYLQKFFGKFRTPEYLEHIAKTLDGLMETTDKYDVRIYDDTQIDGWADAFYHITSCMSTKTKAYGVGEHETYRCYCTAAMTNGKKSSGLRLVVLYQDGKPVARSITYISSCGEKCYVRNYGDDRLVKWLHEHGYVHRQWLPSGTRLWTECYGSGNAGYLSPYVDGEDDDDALATLEFVDGQPYWVMTTAGVELQNSCGYTREIPLTCNCCAESISEGDEYVRTDVHGNEVMLCCVCKDDYCYTVNGNTYVYVDDDDLDELITTNTQCCYTQEYFDDNGLILTGGGDVISIGEAEYCPYADEYYSLSDFTDLSGEPEFVHDTWSGYINDNDRVRTSLYHSDGTYIEDLDCYVHDAHVKEVLARLASLENEA